MTARAYTVASLAAAWECSEGVVRKLIAGGKLGSFRVGTLIRIPADEVERFECQNIASSGSGADTRSSGETKRESATAAPLGPPIDSARRRRLASDGASATVLNGPWER